MIWGESTTLAQSFEWGQELARVATEQFRPPIALEFEKTLCPLLLFKKKRYVGLQFEAPTESGRFAAKGVQIVRRDVCPAVQTIYRTALQMVLNQRRFDGAREYALGAAEALLRGRVPLADLVVSKTLRKEYKNEMQPHLKVAAKIEARQGPAGRPRIGDRVPFVYVCGKRNAKAADLAEDPEHVAEAGLTPDYMRYFEKGLQSPLTDLFTLEAGAGADLQAAFKTIKLRCQGQRFITGYFSRR